MEDYRIGGYRRSRRGCRGDLHLTPAGLGGGGGAYTSGVMSSFAVELKATHEVVTKLQRLLQYPTSP